MLPEAPSSDRRTRRRICKISLIRVAVSPVSLSALVSYPPSAQPQREKDPFSPRASVSRRPASTSRRCLSVSISGVPSRLSCFHPFRPVVPSAAASSARARACPPHVSITNAAKFLIGDTEGREGHYYHYYNHYYYHYYYSLAVQQGPRAVARPLDLSGRNARLARPLFHPPVAFREHFSQRCPTLPQHFAQSHPHCGLCNCHPRFYSRSLPAARVSLPLPPFRNPRCRSTRAISFAHFYLSQTEIEVAAPLSALESNLQARARGPRRGLSINYGQFSALLFTYIPATERVRLLGRAEHTAGYCKYLMSSCLHVADLSPSFRPLRRACERSLSLSYFKRRNAIFDFAKSDLCPCINSRAYLLNVRPYMYACRYMWILEITASGIYRNNAQTRGIGTIGRLSSEEYQILRLWTLTRFTFTSTKSVILYHYA